MNDKIIIIKRVVVLFLAFFCFSLNMSYAATATEKNIVSNHLPAYQLGAGDMLEISVWKEVGLEKQVLVRPDGGITFPLIGEIQAGGKTPAQLQKFMVEKLSKYIPEPVVMVSVLQTASNHIYVIGKVARSSEFVAKSYVNVMQALTMAGGLNSFAKAADIKILRQVNGKEVAISFDYDAVSQGENLKQNITLQSGDVVVVP